MAKGSYQVSAVPVTIFAHLLVIAVSTLVLVWLLYYRGGLAFNSQNKQKIFNVHPLLMVLGFLLPAGEAIMANKSIPAKKEVQKLVHLVLHFIALACGIVGIYAVFKFHDEVGAINMYTLHSWIGMSTICLFGFQWLLGFFSFWWPRAEQGTRAKYMPWHVFLGAVIFFMATVTAETGLVEKFLFLGLGKSHEALTVNFTGLLILLFAVSVGLTVVLPRSSY